MSTRRRVRACAVRAASRHSATPRPVPDRQRDENFRRSGTICNGNLRIEHFGASAAHSREVGFSYGCSAVQIPVDKSRSFPQSSLFLNAYLSEYHPSRRFVDYYQRHGGVDCTAILPHELRNFAVFGCLKRVAQTIDFLHPFCNTSR